MAEGSRSSFVGRCISGDALPDEIDDYVERWHEGDRPEPLHAFLGMTKAEYMLWLADPDALPAIIDAHRRLVPAGTAPSRKVR